MQNLPNESAVPPLELSPTMRKVILHWGEMGARWGVNRSIGQIHALLYLIGRPVAAEAICETLDLARSNVSTSLKELQAWDLISLQHEFGDRRDYFVAKGDLWDILIAIADGRKKREIDPTLEALAAAAIEAETDPLAPKDVKRRIAEMHRFVATLSGWYDQMKALPRATLMKLLSLGAKVGKMVS